MTSPTAGPPVNPPASSLAGTALSAGAAIGQYFNLTSAIPAILLVLWTYALFVVGAVSGTPDLDRLPAGFSLSFSQIALLLVVTVFVGLFLHPVQFGTTRLLEGYWGSRPLAVAASAALTNRHRSRKRVLRDRARRHRKQCEDYVASVMATHPPGDLRSKLTTLLATQDGDAIVAAVIGRQEALRKLADFPNDARMMPTHLGNALRRDEDAAGQPYGLNAIGLATHFHMVSESRHLEYVQDARQSMDTAIRLWLISIVATVETVLVTLTDGLWLLVALGPYALALLAYRGGVAAAREHGAVLRAMFDLNRFALYEAMQLRRPVGLDAEIAQNRMLDAALVHGKEAPLVYRTDADQLTPKSDTTLRTRWETLRADLTELFRGRQDPDGGR